MLKIGFEITKGTKQSIRLLIKDESGAVVDLTGWTRVRLGFAGSDEETPDAILDSNTSPASFTVTAATGQIDIDLSSSFTGELEAEELKCELAINFTDDVLIPEQFRVLVRESIVL